MPSVVTLIIHKFAVPISTLAMATLQPCVAVTSGPASSWQIVYLGGSQELEDRRPRKIIYCIAAGTVTFTRCTAVITEPLTHISPLPWAAIRRPGLSAIRICCTPGTGRACVFLADAGPIKTDGLADEQVPFLLTFFRPDIWRLRTAIFIRVTRSYLGKLARSGSACD